jgi:hypothetical protein
MTYEEALRKAAACLRLSKSSNQAEAALAAAKAQEIMDKYQISAEVLKLDQPKEADEPVMDFGSPQWLRLLHIPFAIRVGRR